jgi:type IV secretion system protein VirD4
MEEGNSKNRFFTESARQLISGVIMHLASGPDFAPEQRTLAYMRDRVTKAPFMFARDAMQTGSDLVKERLARFAEPEAPSSKSMTDIISTANTETGFISNAAIANSLAASDFDFRALKRQPMTVYVVVPAKYLGVGGKWFRLIVAAALDALLEPGRGVQVLMVMDEFARLGQLAAIRDGMADSAGHGLQLWPVMQNLAQFRVDYKDEWETFLAGADIQQFFRPREMFTAEYVSKLCGKKTIVLRSTSQNTSPKGETSTSESHGYHQSDLFLPDEVMRLEGDRFLMFAAGVPFVTKGFRTGYDNKQICPELQGLFDPDPYEQDPKQNEDNTAGNSDSEGARNGASRNGGMTRADALDILGLKEGATREEVNAAWRRVIQQVHRDKGGSDYLTRQVNQARDILLGL